ncbi:MAG: helix-turn-helix domain-containing protein [Anaerolineales bacterium]|jgi:uncharacterized Tic20 family protein/DNA-binding Xre family transcriptional regulator
MKQPELGMKVSELRQEKGMTQESLAEICEISTRTVQRIESGEVDPRLFTLNTLGEVLEFDFTAGDLENETLWLAALHLSSTLSIVLIPLLIWSWKKKQSYKVDRHGRDVLNFQITITILLFVSVLCLMLAPVALIVRDASNPPPIGSPSLGVLEIMVIGATIPLFLIGLFTFYQGIKNTIRVLSDKPYYYPLSIKFVK